MSNEIQGRDLVFRPYLRSFTDQNCTNTHTRTRPIRVEYKTIILVSLTSLPIKSGEMSETGFFMPPTLKKLEGHNYCFRLVCLSVCLCIC